MSAEVQVPSGEPAQEPSGSAAGSIQPQSPSGTKQETVQYETYAKGLAQEKALRERNKELEAKLQDAERSKLEAEGNKEELIAHLKKENETIKAQSIADKAEKTKVEVDAQIMRKAQELGCVDPDMAKELVKFSELNIDQSNKVGEDSLSMALDRLKRNKPYLFQGQKAAVVDAPPASPGTVGVTSPSSLADMTTEQMEALYRKKFGGA